MKRFVSIFVMLALLCTGCTEAYDDSEIRKELADLKERMAALEKLTAELNDAQKAGVSIISYTAMSDGTGWKITFSDGSTIEVTDGVDGKDGKDGKDGTNGEDGKDGAPGKDGTDGSNGAPGDSLIKSIEEDGNTIVIVLTNGTKYTFAKAPELTLDDPTTATQTAYADETATDVGSFSFTAPQAWTASVSETTTINTRATGSGIEWLRLMVSGVETYEGAAGNFTLAIELDPNYTGKTRSAMITISCGGMVITIVVTQEGTKEDDTIPVGGVSLSTTTLSLLVGESETLTATVTPETATNQNVSWTSSNDNVATVDATGKVTAAKAGTADITVITEEGDRTAVCKVTVTAPLVFNDNTTFDIPASVTQMAIKNIYVLSGVSGGVKPYMFSAEGLPAGITIDASTGVISGTPTAPIAAGTAILTVKDASSPQQSQNIDIEYGEVAATATPDPDYFGTWRIQEYRQYTISVDGSISFEEFDRSEYNYTLTDLTWIPVTAPGDNYFAAEYPTGYRIVGMVAANGGSYYAPAVGSMYELCFFIHTDNGSLAVGMNGSGDRPYYPSDIWCIKQP